MERHRVGTVGRIHKVMAVVLGLCVVSFLSAAAFGKKPPKPPDPPDEEAQIRIGPYLQNATPSSIVVIWETESGDESTVEYGPAADNLNSSASGETLASRRSNIHQTELNGLTPDSTYHYRVRTGTMVSEIYHFVTPPLPSSEASFRFTVYSDAQRNRDYPDMHREVVNDGIIGYLTTLVAPEELDVPSELAFNLVVGDLVDKGDKTGEWETFFDEMFNLGVQVPYYTVLGNHEYDDDNYFNFMDNPHNGVPAYDEHWYFVDYSNVRIIGLDSNSAYRMQEQLDWLDAVLLDTEDPESPGEPGSPHIDFVFAMLHHPYKSELWVPGEIDFTGEVIARLEDFSNRTGKPSVHFFGHTHAYSRGQSRDAAHNWICVASAEGDIDYWGEYENADYDEFQVSLPEWGFLLVEVGAGAHPYFQASWVSRGNEFIAGTNDTPDVFTVRRYTDPPDQPVAVSPVFDPGNPTPPVDVVLQGSSFVDPDVDDHLESHFQITTISGDFTAPLVDRWVRTHNLYSPPGATGRENGYYSVDTVTDWERDVTHTMVPDLPPETDLYWRVRYRDASLEWSDWSVESRFVTGP